MIGVKFDQHSQYSQTSFAKQGIYDTKYLITADNKAPFDPHFYIQKLTSRENKSTLNSLKERENQIVGK